MRTRVKICCISSWEEAQLAIQAGADALGLVSAMPSGPGVIDEGTIANITAQTPPPVASFLLTSLTDVQAIIAQHRRLKSNTIQLVDALQTGTYEELRQGLPGISLVQVIHVVDESSIDEALAVAPHVDAILLDSGNPNLKVKELGGTGRTHNWDISRKIREALPIPMFLAGGLKPDNIQEAIQRVQPFGVDLCSGVRTDGKLDGEKLSKFFETLKI